MTIYNKEMSEERKKVLESRPILEAEDIANAVLYVLSTPEHVQVLVFYYYLLLINILTFLMYFFSRFMS